MGNFFQDILDKIIQSEKDVLIRASGSTRDGGNQACQRNVAMDMRAAPECTNPYKKIHRAAL